MEKLIKIKEAMNEAFKNSTIPDEIDVEFVNNMLLDIRRKFVSAQANQALRRMINNR
jgi:hypothetical protein